MKITAALFLFALVSAPNAWGHQDRKTVGALVRVGVAEANAEFVARVDTGAQTSSINAANVLVTDGFASFDVIDAGGQAYAIRSRIVKEASVRNAESIEKRYYVYLTIEYGEDSRKVLVNLNDRSAATHKLLLGRNWLSGAYLVDVDQ